MALLKSEVDKQPRCEIPAPVIVGQFLQTFKGFPPSQKSGSISVSQFLDVLQSGASGAGH